MFLALRSPLVLLGLPTLGWRFVSGNPAYWGMNFHYNAVLARIPDGATVAAANRLARHLTSRCRVLLFPLRPASDALPGLGYQLAAESDNIMLFHRS